MAAILKKSYELLDLKVSLDTSGMEAKVALRLETSRDGQTREWGRWEIAPSDLGLSGEMGMGDDRRLERSFKFPGQTGELLKGVLRSLTRNPALGEQPVLWLHLEKPYGMLGVVPWERFLLPYVEPRPIVRLPDFILLPPRETPGTLDVVLCGSSPVAKSEIPLVDYITRFADRIREAVLPRRATIHVFTDQAAHRHLKRSLLQEEGEDSGSHPRLYDPAHAPNPSRTGAGGEHPGVEDQADNPWLRWILEEMSGRSVDVLHFITHGYLALEHPALAVAESPTRNEDMNSARFIGPSLLNRFMTQVGAWSLACTSPPSDYSPMGLRLFTGTIAHLRPGSFLYHEFRDVEQDLATLESAYSFLFSGRNGGAPSAPKAPDLFLYCQPFQLRPMGFGDSRSFASRRRSLPFMAADVFRSTQALEMASAEMVGDAAPFRTVFAEDAPNVPSWIATTERYLEQGRWQLMKWEQDDREGKLGEVRREEMEGLREALALIERTASDTVLHTRRRTDPEPGRSSPPGGSAATPERPVPGRPDEPTRSDTDRPRGGGAAGGQDDVDRPDAPPMTAGGAS